MPLPQHLLDRIESEATREYLPIIGRDRAELVFRLVEEMKPCRSVEIGVMTGYATAAIAAALPDSCQVFGIEMDSALAERAESNLIAVGLDRKAVILRGDARELIDSLQAPIDFVLLDAQKSQYLGNLRKLEPKLAPGAMVVANGTAVYHREVQPYLAYLKESGKWQTRTEVFQDDAMEVSRWIGPK